MTTNKHLQGKQYIAINTQLDFTLHCLQQLMEIKWKLLENKKMKMEKSQVKLYNSQYNKLSYYSNKEEDKNKKIYIKIMLHNK